jgi:hypothetical protein
VSVKITDVKKEEPKDGKIHGQAVMEEESGMVSRANCKSTSDSITCWW